MSEWFVAKVKPNNEQKVQAYLGSFRVEVYIPTIVVTKLGKRSLEPLFPGYVFVKATPESREWPIIRWAPGLSYFLPNRDDPMALPSSLVDDIVAKVSAWNDGGWITAMQPGDKVRVTAGPLKTLDAIFQRYVPGKQRCEVLVTLLGRLQKVSVDITSVKSSGRQKFGA